MLGLRVLEDIETANRERFGFYEMRSIDVKVPVEPRPEPVTVSDRALRKLERSYDQYDTWAENLSMGCQTLRRQYSQVRPPSNDSSTL